MTYILKTESVLTLHPYNTAFNSEVKFDYMVIRYESFNKIKEITNQMWFSVYLLFCQDKHNVNAGFASSLTYHSSDTVD